MYTIEIEQLLFEDFNISVYDESKNLILDKKYLCRWYSSALLTAYRLLVNYPWSKIYDIIEWQKSEVPNSITIKCYTNK